MSKVLNLTFASSLMKLCEINSSFDSGVLRIAYPGKNRNGSFISKKTFENCIDTIFNCPIVTNYDRETDTLGGHDMEVVSDSNGNIKLINLTTPVGVVPESANWFWADIEDDDGEIREYLCTEVLLWKRQEAYQKIKSDGIVEQSMEITVKSGEMINGVYNIYDFEFTAFALIGVTPCFQGASLEVFSKKGFKQQFTEMMQELRENYKEIEAFKKVDDIKEFSMEGGKTLDEKINLANEYGIDINSLDFSIEDLTFDELKEKFEEIKANGDPVVIEKSSDEPVTEEPKKEFELQGNITESIIMALESEKVQHEWGETIRYCFVDYDIEVHEVYCWDTTDWLLYGFEYENNGDNINIKFDSKKRMKFAIVDFDEGEQPSPIASVFAKMNEVIAGYAEREMGYKADTEKFASMEIELASLREFKAQADEAIAREERDAIFEKFTDLIGDEAFENLKVHSMEYELDTLEDKCFAIRGRKASVAKFSLEEKNPVIKIDKSKNNLKNDEPYGSIFVKYGIGQTN